MWNPINPCSQTVFAANPGQFEVIANMPAGNGAVISYPSNGITYSNPTNTSLPLLLHDITSFTSTFNEVQPDASLPGVASEAAYDTWWNNYANEIMVQHDMIDSSNLRGGFPTLLTATFGGTDGIPVHNWNLGIFGSEIIWQLADGVVDGVGGIQEGSIDFRAMVNWLADRGYMVHGLASPCTAVGYGWEICSTNGEYQLYRCNGFTSTFTYCPMETSPGTGTVRVHHHRPAPLDIINNVTVAVTEYQSQCERAAMHDPVVGLQRQHTRADRDYSPRCPVHQHIQRQLSHVLRRGDARDAGHLAGPRVRQRRLRVHRVGWRRVTDRQLQSAGSSAAAGDG